MLIALAPALKETLGSRICCTLQGENIFLDRLEESDRSRALALIQKHGASVDRFVAVSDYCAEHMSRYLQIPGAKVDVVPLGINVDGYEPRKHDSSGPFVVGYLGRIAPEKGLHLLCDAYHRLRAQGGLEGCRLELGGYLGPEHRPYLEGIMRQAREWGLENEVQYHGEFDRDEKIAFLQRLDVFAVPATYDDPKGLGLVEAMACGVPVLAPRRGTYTELIERTGGGVLVEPEDVDAFSSELNELHRNDKRRAELSQCGAAGVRQHYTADIMAQRALDVYTRLSGGVSGVRETTTS